MQNNRLIVLPKLRWSGVSNWTVTYADNKATGPPTQATGPRRSGAGVGVGMLRGAGDPSLDFCLDLEIYRDPTTVKFRLGGKNWEEPIVLDPGE